MIHKFIQKDLHIVMDISSGAVHAVDPLVYALLDHYPNPDKAAVTASLAGEFSKEAVTEAFEEIEALIEAGQLFSEDAQIEAFRMSRHNPVIKALCLHVAHDCNIRCQYCFAAQGAFDGHRTLMSYETGVKALDFLIANSGNRKQLEVDFFGGEPLMNFETVKRLVTYGRSIEQKHNKTFRFTMTTNGVLLDAEKIAYINEEMHNLVLSIDGRKAVNDRMRETISGDGTYDLIVPKFQEAVATRAGKSYYVRGTFTRFSKDFSKDVIHLAELGFDQVSVEPVVAPKNEPYALQDSDVQELCAEYEALAEAMLEKEKRGEGFNFFHFQIDLNRGPCVIKRVLGCGAGAEYLAVTPEGDIYPCHQFVGMPEFRLGSLFSDEPINADIVSEFAAATVLTKEACRECWARFYCSGGCHANAWHENGSVLKPYRIGCELEKKRVECAIYLQTKRLLEENQ